MKKNEQLEVKYWGAIRNQETGLIERHCFEGIIPQNRYTTYDFALNADGKLIRQSKTFSSLDSSQQNELIRLGKEFIDKL